LKISVNKKDLLKVLSNIQSITNNKTNLNITECINLKSDGEDLIIAATDTEIGFETKIKDIVNGYGDVVCNAKKLFEIIKEFPDSIVKIETDSEESENKTNYLLIESNKLKVRLTTKDKDNFPYIDKQEDLEKVQISCAVFKKCIEKTLLVEAAKDDRRPHINGVELIIKDKTITTQSTDGARLIVCNYPIEDTIEKKCLVPKKALKALNKFLGEGDVYLSFTDNFLYINYNSSNFVIRLLEGQFPAVNELVLNESCAVVKIDKNTFKEAIKRIAILTSETFKAVTFDIIKNSCTLSSQSPEIGNAEELIVVDTELTLKINFNPLFFIDILDSVNTETIELFFKDERTPCKMFFDNLIVVIMPMKL